jgi:hypothetical protein
MHLEIMRVGLLLCVFWLAATKAKCQDTRDSIHLTSTGNRPFQVDKLLFTDQFGTNLKNWVIEFAPSPGSSIGIKNNKLVIDVAGGATVWLNKMLSGNIMITYQRKVIVDSGKNDRLSDLNQFWMASDPKRKKLFTRTGEFSEYDSLLLYYAGIGGNSNTTTRFRKYTGDGKRMLYFDLNDKDHLLVANKGYQVSIVVLNGATSFFLDDKLFFSYEDKRPLQAGYFGFRTTQSRQEIDDFKVYRLK